MEEEEKIMQVLLDKSIDAFMLAIEIYNKPTITYRLDSFIILLSNAWDNVMKVKLIKDNGIDSIYYSDNKYKTLPISKLLNKVYNNKNNPIYQNLAFLIKLRDTASHFVIPELNDELFPIFQANITNYTEFMFEFFNINISNKFNFKFMSFMIDTNSSNENQIIRTYGNSISEYFKKIIFETSEAIEQNSNFKFSNNINVNLVLTKKAENTDITAFIDKNSKQGVTLVKDIKNPNDYYSLSPKQICKKINKKLENENINCKINVYSLNLIVDHYSLKSNNNYYFFYKLPKRWGCNISLVNFIFEVIKSDINIIEKIKNKKR